MYKQITYESELIYKHKKIDAVCIDFFMFVYYVLFRYLAI